MPAASDTFWDKDTEMVDLHGPSNTPAISTTPTSSPSSLRKRTHSEYAADSSPTPPSPLGERCSLPLLPPINTNIVTSIPEPCEPVSPAPTEVLEECTWKKPETAEEFMLELKQQGIKVRDFAYEPFPHEWKAPVLWDPVPTLVNVDWYMVNPSRNPNRTSARELWRLVKLGWINLSKLKNTLPEEEYRAVEAYGSRTNPPPSNFVVVPKENRQIPTATDRVLLLHRWGYPKNADDITYTQHFGYPPLNPPTPEKSAENNEQPTAEEPQAKRQKTGEEQPRTPLRRSKPLSRGQRSRGLL
ncbi:hypothetical protein BV25DRAFT_136775 [Artomyces pyxidatus]|uniref:Uncharacterized protein n=1 Tax=Artomyces pyxidatus TaxID=48021 RepID=A0ACB8T9Z3_9AGAM|nr:hypothetical protein BV25DRAFT_136775 [Artomyces pyxidatus]